MKYLALTLLFIGCCPDTKGIPGHCFKSKGGSIIAKATEITEYEINSQFVVYTTVASDRGESAEEENGVDYFKETFPTITDCNIYYLIKDGYDRFDRLETRLDKLYERVRKLDPHHPTQQQRAACIDACNKKSDKSFEEHKYFKFGECIVDCGE